MIEYSLEGKVALVTGGGRGIGKAIAEQMAKAGAHVICVSKTEGTCQAVANGLVEKGMKASHAACDVGNANEVKVLCENILGQYNTVDILVNNAGITKDMLAMRMTDEDWDSVIQTNLTSCFYFIRNLLRPMTQKRWGRIINISSITGLIGNAGQINYAAAKAGMLGLTKSLAKEVASRNITVNAVCPGFIKTDMTEVLNDKIKEFASQMIPLKRFGEAEDIANMVTFLASELSNYITGQTFSVDGGLAM